MKQNELLADLESHFGSLAKVRNMTLSVDNAEILHFLLEDSCLKEQYKRRFFTQISSTLVFNKESFLDFLDSRILDKSYTHFTNKIGLSHLGKFLKAKEEVVLNFPFKDCTFKGTSSKDEQKNDEIFFNDVIAKDEIDVLFSPKILQHFELIDTQEVSITESYHSQALAKAQGDLQQERERRIKLENILNEGNFNLLLKGNNLLALHTLKQRKDIYGQVKLIYIDPPYNTGNDSFNYNDRFNHSTYLCFMKNRLEIAREFLSDDGVIFIQCDDNEQAYLKVLCDEVFGREEFVGCLVWLKGNAQNDADTIQRNQEYILCYAKSVDSRPINQISQDVRVKAFKDEKTGKFYYEGAGLSMGGGDGGSLENRPNLGYTFYYNPKTKDIKPLLDYDKADVKTLTRHDELYKDDKNLIKKGYVPIRPPKMGAGNGCWKWALEKTLNELDRILIKSGKEGYSVLRKEYLESKQVKQDENGEFYAIIEKVNPPKSFVDFVGSGRGTTELKILYGTKVFNNPKPEALLKRILEISTKENDLVMDFFAGSGTTLAVAHKMNRRYVGIEQMDYIESITKERLKKVIAGEQGGISKVTNWKGGGGFCYCELMPLNAGYKEKIVNLSDEKEFQKLYKILKEKAFIDYRIDLNEILKDKDFQALDFKNKKAFLLQVLDSNMDYMLLGDLEDKDLHLSEELIAFNKAFYKRES